MPPMKNEKQVTKKRNINVILTPNSDQVLKKLRSENCAVHVFVPGKSLENFGELQSELQPRSVKFIT